MYVKLLLLAFYSIRSEVVGVVLFRAESKTIQYFCNYRLILKFLIISFLITLDCLGLRIFEIIDSLIVTPLRNSLFGKDLVPLRYLGF